MSLYVEDRGTGQAVVLLHGAPTTPAHMRPLAEGVAKKRRSLLVHLPGYGESARLDPYDLERSHELVEQTLLALGVREAHFVGLSGGSYRSFALACRGKVSVLSVTAFGGLADFPADEAAGLREYVRLLHEGIDPVPIVEQLMLTERSKQSPAIVADVRAWATAAPPDHLASELAAFASAPDLRARLDALGVSILMRVGTLDQATPPVRSERVASIVRCAKVETVEGVGHAILAEDPAGSLEAVERHLDVVEAARRSR